MSTTFIEAGTNATYGLEFYDTVSASIAQTSSKYALTGTGSRSIQLLGGYCWKKAIVTDAGARASFWVRFDEEFGFPNGNCNILVVFTSGGSQTLAVRVISTGKLQVVKSGNTQIGSDGSTLTTGTWYQITLAYTIASSTVNEIRVYLNNVLDITITNATLGGTGTDGIAFNSDVSNTYCFFTALYVDNSSALTDVGSMLVTAKLPAANNTNNFNTAIGANPANRWENVDERPISTTNGWEETGITGAQENYGLQVASAGDVDISSKTLVSRCAWLWAKIDSASVAAKIMDNGTESAITLTTSAALATLITDSISYPSNAAGIGIKASTTPNTFIYDCGTIIAYLPATSTDTGEWQFGQPRRNSRTINVSY